MHAALTAAIVDDLPTMAVAFVVAVIIVGPFAWRLARRTEAVLDERDRRDACEDEVTTANEAGDGASPEAEPSVEAPSVDDVLATIDRLGNVDTQSPERTGSGAELVVPDEVTYRGKPLADAVRDRIIDDALTQAGWTVIDKRLGAAGSLWTIRSVGRQRDGGGDIER